MKKGAAPTGQAAHPAAEEYAAAEQRRHVRRPRHARLAAAQLGRSRGGPTGKVHRSADRSRRPLSFAVAPGQAGDSPQFAAVPAKAEVRSPPGRPRTRPDVVAPDQARFSRACEPTSANAASKP